MASGGRRLVGLTVWGDGKVYESLDRPGELSFDVIGGGPDGRPMEVLLGDDDKGVRFFDLSTDPPKLLPIGERPRDRVGNELVVGKTRLAGQFYTKEGGCTIVQMSKEEFMDDRRWRQSFTDEQWERFCAAKEEKRENLKKSQKVDQEFAELIAKKIAEAKSRNPASSP
ncbi:unnamed protein product [Vitrella brassicaformis CCMP3155]|uniref:Uncharacterized protein n=3 Tax=Vitrella brassicaformis TaxID=1169539 RepID=A0A0G4EFQ2_VITBC|nr:unnamed protein product [Vitrella brassicaformis CCMP3155]|eukprot:CEL94208.1 unnamed protein product [Vitrella brassicaformis CCMP3155]